MSSSFLNLLNVRILTYFFGLTRWCTGTWGGRLPSGTFGTWFGKSTKNSTDSSTTKTSNYAFKYCTTTAWSKVTEGSQIIILDYFAFPCKWSVLYFFSLRFSCGICFYLAFCFVNAFAPSLPYLLWLWLTLFLVLVCLLLQIKQINQF